MPSDHLDPGVHIEEPPSGTRTIIGTSTSVAAFVGWASRGRADTPVRCFGWSEFEREFGGIDARSHLGYAVSHFFANGGGECHVLRLTGPEDKVAVATVDGLKVMARGPGTWANAYTVVATPNADDAERFRLDVVDRASGTALERHTNLSWKAEDSRYVGNVLGEHSSLITAIEVDHTQPITAQTSDLAGGADGSVMTPGSADFDRALFGDGSGTGVHTLGTLEYVNLLNVPGYTNVQGVAELEKICRDKRIFLIVDASEGMEAGEPPMTAAPDKRLTGTDAINAAYYYPWLLAPDPENDGKPRAFPPGGAVAGLFARTDDRRGIWHAPAGLEADLRGVFGVTVPLTDPQNGSINAAGVNCIRQFPNAGTVVWGARTLAGGDGNSSDWKYVPVRRTAMYIEESIRAGLSWAVFETNGEALWSEIRRLVGAFLHDLFRKGAFKGAKSSDAYFVNCGHDTTTQHDLDLSRVNIIVGFAPLKPAEFTVLSTQLLVGQHVPQ